jgi:hypothetical protein
MKYLLNWKKDKFRNISVFEEKIDDWNISVKNNTHLIEISDCFQITITFELKVTGREVS